MPLKVREMIKLIEADGWHLDRVSGEPSAVPPSGETRHDHDRGQAEYDVAAGHREEHPEAGGNREAAAVTGFVVILERGEDGGFGAWSPDLPGCVAVGDTYDECVELMRQAIPLHLDSLRRHGDPVPSPVTVGVLTIDPA